MGALPVRSVPGLGAVVQPRAGGEWLCASMPQEA